MEWTFNKRVNSRISQIEKDRMEEIVMYKRTSDNRKKYSSESHFIRCAIIKLIYAEYPGIKQNSG